MARTFADPVKGLFIYVHACRRSKPDTLLIVKAFTVLYFLIQVYLYFFKLCEIMIVSKQSARGGGSGCIKKITRL